jgi:hypothetical protein
MVSGEESKVWQVCVPHGPAIIEADIQATNRMRDPLEWFEPANHLKGDTAPDNLTQP